MERRDGLNWGAWGVHVLRLNAAGPELSTVAVSWQSVQESVPTFDFLSLFTSAAFSALVFRWGRLMLFSLIWQMVQGAVWWVPSIVGCPSSTSQMSRWHDSQADSMVHAVSVMVLASAPATKACTHGHANDGADA